MRAQGRASIPDGAVEYGGRYFWIVGTHKIHSLGMRVMKAGDIIVHANARLA